MFDKEALLQYIITKKNEISRKLKEYEKQKHKEEEELVELGRAEQQSKVNDFLNRESMVKKQNDIYKIKPQKETEKSASSLSNMANGLDKQLPSFWVPSETPDAKKPPMQKPVRFSMLNNRFRLLVCRYLIYFVHVKYLKFSINLIFMFTLAKYN